MSSPTEKQIKLVETVAEVLGVNFPQSSQEFTKQIYYLFIRDHYDAYRNIVNDVNDVNFEDEMAWFQMLNG